MKLAKNSRRLTIFEGPDGGGKSTAAKAFAEATDARYVHFQALPKVGSGLARMYVEAMMPALLGYQDVVFDRCWLSEVPYSNVFREGTERLDQTSMLMLERLAMRCGAIVVMCLPSVESVVRTFNGRRGAEMLKDDTQLTSVYNIYKNELYTSLPVFNFDYDAGFDIESYVTDIFKCGYYTHPLASKSAGNLAAPTLIVGDKFTDHKNDDAFYQWPFASFSDVGVSRWLTESMFTCGAHESQLLWANSDDLTGLQDIMDRRLRFELKHPVVVTLSTRSFELAAKSGIFNDRFLKSVGDPQIWKRFHSSILESYQLWNLARSASNKTLQKFKMEH